MLFTRRVALERFELSQAEPESDVLPLHHKAISVVLTRVSATEVLSFCFDVAKVGSFSEPCKFLYDFFEKNLKKAAGL